MSTHSTPTVQALDKFLRDLVHWERVAIHLPEMRQPTIDKIRHDYSGIDNRKQALYENWLRSYPHATWSNVLHALEAVGENRLAESIRLTVGTTMARSRNTKKFAETIDDGVVTELRQLNKAFDILAEEVEKRCSGLVKSNEISLDDLSRPFCRSKSGRISGIQNVQSVSDLFALLSDHYSFLDCGILEKVVEKLPQSNELLTTVQKYIDSVRKFKCESPIRCLKTKLQPFVRQALFNEISLMVVFELEEAWDDMDLRLFETLLETLFPALCKEMTWYKIDKGSLLVTFVTFKDNKDALLSMIEQKENFIKLVGVIRLKIDEKIVLDGKETKSFSFESALLEASSVNNHEALLFLLTVVGVDIDHQDETGQTALMIAVTNNNAEIAQILLKAKADPNHQGKDGDTALHIACYAGYTQLAVLLLEFGASLTVTNNKGDTPFLSAIRGKMMEVVMIIVPKLPKSQIPLAVLLACRLGYSDIISCLLQYIDPPSSRIHHYCASGDLALAAQHIVEFSEDVDSTLEFGISPLMIASSCGHVEVVECLIEANANIKCVDQDGYSALAYAIVGTQSLAVVECLLQAQADPFITVGGDNLLQIAKANSDLTDLLLQYMALQLYSMYSSFVEKIQRDLANEVAVHKVTVQEIKSKLLSDPEVSHIEGIAKVSSCSELFTCLKPHHDFLSWKVISFLSDCLKRLGYFQLVETFEANFDIQKFPKVISNFPQLESNVFSSTCSELTLSLHREWGIQSMSNLRRLNVLLFSSLARLMSHIAVSVTQQEILVKYRISKSMKLAERIKSLFSQKQVVQKFGVLGLVEVLLTGECIFKTYQSLPFSFQSAIFWATAAPSILSSEKLKFLRFITSLKDTDPNYKSVEGNSALLLAAGKGYSSVVDFLLSIGAEPDAGNDKGFTPLMAASHSGHLDIVKTLVHSCPSAVNTISSGGTTNLSKVTPLMFASLSGKTDVVQFLLQHSSNPNISAAIDFTALMLASTEGFTEIVKLLLEAGADPNMIKNDVTALAVAISNGHSPTVKLLLSYNADHRRTVFIQGIPCDSFAFACSIGNIEIVHVFLDAGIVSERSLSIGWYVACLCHHSHLIISLIYSLPQVSSNNRELVSACVKGDLAYIKNALHHPDDVEFVHGVTPLMVACSCGHTGIVKALLDAGASVSRSDEFGYKAVDYCKIRIHSPIPNILSTKEVTKRTFNAEAFFPSFGSKSYEKEVSN